MLSPNQIGRFIANEDYRRLVDRLLTNGRCHSRRAQALLHAPESLEVAAIGLGLQRICELAYWPVPDGSELAHRLMRLQHRDGLFAGQIGASAVALRGLIEWSGGFDQREDECLLLERSVERGVRALAAAWSGAALDSESLAQWAIVLWQLGDSSEVLAPLLQSIRKAVAASDPHLLCDDLTRLALTMAA
ncbi:MAG TPA: hypothetical protein VMS30_08120 [Phycisphaerales bacterium]|nr:hypothetical protein [Phycisphaerales bacterium]